MLIGKVWWWSLLDCIMQNCISFREQRQHNKANTREKADLATRMFADMLIKSNYLSPPVGQPSLWQSGFGWPNLKWTLVCDSSLLTPTDGFLVVDACDFGVLGAHVELWNGARGLERILRND